MDIFTLFGNIVLDGQEKVNQQLSGLEKNAEKVSKGLKVVGAAFTAVGVAGLAIVASTKKINTELAAAGVNLGMTGKEMRGLALDVTNVTFPLESVVATFNLLSKAGITTAEDMKTVANDFDLLADAVGSTAEMVGETMIMGMKTFRKEVAESGKYLDNVTYLTKNTTLSIEDLNSVLGYTTAEAVDMGLTFEDTIAILGVLEDKGVSGAVATRAWRSALTESEKTGKSMGEVLGVTNDEIAEFNDKISDATGITQKYADISAEQFTIMDKLKQKWSELTLGASGFLEPLEPILAGLTALGPLMIGFSMVKIPSLIAAWHGLQSLMTTRVIPAITGVTAALWAKVAALYASMVAMGPAGWAMAATSMVLIAGGLAAIAIKAKDALSGLTGKVEDYISPTREAAGVTKEFSDNLSELETVTREVSEANDLLAQANKWLVAIREERTKTIEEQIAEEKELVTATDKVTAAEGYSVEQQLLGADALEALIATTTDSVNAKEAYLKTLLAIEDPTSKEIEAVITLTGELTELNNARKIQLEALEEANRLDEERIRLDEERIRKYKDFIAVVDGIGEAFIHSQTEAGELGVSFEDLINYALEMGIEINLTREHFEEFGFDVNKAAEAMEIDLALVADSFSDVRERIDGVTEALIYDKSEAGRYRLTLDDVIRTASIMGRTNEWIERTLLDMGDASSDVNSVLGAMGFTAKETADAVGKKAVAVRDEAEADKDAKKAADDLAKAYDGIGKSSEQLKADLQALIAVGGRPTEEQILEVHRKRLEEKAAAKVGGGGAAPLAVRFPQPAVPEVLGEVERTVEDAIESIREAGERAPTEDERGEIGYERGGIAMRPMLARVGELAPRIPEVMIPLSQEALGKLGLGGPAVLITGNTFNVRDDRDIDRVADQLVNRIRLRTGVHI